MRPTAIRRVIQATQLAKTTRSSQDWPDARRRVIESYRDWQRAAPDIVKLYLLDIGVPAIRAKIRQEFERHRHVKDLGTVDVLLSKADMEYQETMNYWKQIPQVLKYFRDAEEPAAYVSKSFMTGFLEGRN